MSEHEFYQRVALMGAGCAASCLVLVAGLVGILVRQHVRITNLENKRG